MTDPAGGARRNPEIRSEKADANAGAIVRFLLYLVLGTVAVVVVLRWMFVTLAAWEERRQPPPPVMKVEVPPQPPLPRLQTQPAQELARYREEQQKALESYGWVNRSAGIVHIPIEEAMRLVAVRGLPVRSEETPKPEGTGAGGKK